MHVRGLIELTPDLDREVFSRLVWAADRLAGDGQVILVLNAVSPRVVNRLLGPSSRRRKHRRGGLRYRPVHAIDDSLLDQMSDSEFVIADSERLSATLLSRGILHMRTREGVHYLQALLPPRDRNRSHSDTGLLTS